jgi:hypothetical protein
LFSWFFSWPAHYWYIEKALVFVCSFYILLYAKSVYQI